MASEKPLSGAELIDCARANIAEGIEVTAKRCGYGNDIAAFQRELHKAGQSLGLDISEFRDLNPNLKIDTPGIEIAPESTTQF